jgi:hypothetical protein
MVPLSSNLEVTQVATMNDSLGGPGITYVFGFENLGCLAGKMNIHAREEIDIDFPSMLS